MNLISASIAVGLIGSASANFEKIQNVLLQLEEAAYNKTIADDPSAANDRGFSSFIMGFLVDIQYYGCWCYLDTDWDTAKGPVQDGLDQECKNLVSNYRCLVLDALDRGDTCDPATQDYVEYNLFGGNTNVINDCSSNGNELEVDSQCRIDLCIADGTFTLNLFSLILQSGGISANTPPYDPAVTHTNNANFPGAFDPAVECVTNGLNGGGRSEKECCGTYPSRYPFKTYGGEKACCGERTYSTLALQCCGDTDVIDINGICSSGSCQKSQEILVNPSEASRSYSSVFDNDPKGTGHARSMVNSPQAWSANTPFNNEYMIIDAGSDIQFSGFIIQPRANDGSNQFITRYEIMFWKDGETEFDAVSLGEFDCDATGYGVKYFSIDMTLVDQPVSSATIYSTEARYFKINPLGFNNHISMRAGLLTCPSI